MGLLAITEAGYILGIDLKRLAVFEIQTNFIGRDSQAVAPVFCIDFGLERTSIVSNIFERAAIDARAQNQHNCDELAGYQLLHGEASTCFLMDCSQPEGDQ